MTPEKRKIGYSTSEEKNDTDEEALILPADTPEGVLKQLEEMSRLRGSGSLRSEIDSDLIEELMRSVEGSRRVADVLDSLVENLGVDLARPKTDEPARHLGFDTEAKP